MNAKKVLYIAAPILAWALTVLVIFFVSKNLSGLIPPQVWNPIGTPGFSGRIILDELKEYLPKLYVVQSGSMEPSLKLGSLVIVKPQESYSANDIVTFSPEGDSETVTHRIAMRRYPEGPTFQPTYITKGDANEEIDRGEVKNENVVGKVVLSIPYLGYGVDFAKKPYGFILLVIVPATIIVYEEIRSLLLQLWKLVKKVRFRKKERVPLPKASILIPSIGAFLIFVGISGAYFFDIEESLANVLGVAESFDLVINEFVYKPGQTFSTEWIEIYNPTDASVDLTNWTIEDLAGNDESLTPLGTINSGDFKVLDISPQIINNSGSETLYLINPSAEIVDFHSFTTTDTGDEAFGRQNDGSFPWKHPCTTPTKGTSNNSSC